MINQFIKWNIIQSERHSQFLPDLIEKKNEKTENLKKNVFHTNVIWIGIIS
jgi:hypothetical protein